MGAGVNYEKSDGIAPSGWLRGVAIYAGFIDLTAQKAMVADLRSVAQTAPPYAPTAPSGKAMSVKITSAGQVGWTTDATGYRYQAHHPAGQGWPQIPEALLAIWRQVAGVDRLPDSCLINFYGEGAKMGMHQDRDEADLQWPVVSISLGDDALFRVGNTTRGGKTESIWLTSGDVLVLGGPARLAYHGIDKTRFGSSTLLPKGGRINVTLRIAQ